MSDWGDLVDLEVCIKVQANTVGVEHEGVPSEGVVVRMASALKAARAERDAALAQVAELEAVIELVREWRDEKQAHEVYEATEDQPAECTDECEWCPLDDILSTSPTKALEARHTIKQIPPWSASPSARYLTGAFECSCGEKFLFLDSRHNPEWREDKRRIAEEHVTLADRKTGEQSNG
ncbi:hypothetical protein [Glaciibacter superstes]|uniref:hypothetical protein n=1 Tax=Glaciibacter superstes TaxID=501023 RepID=UPI0003B59E62|nr:hypothetical protein [Glaciibacter superstes]